MNYQYPQNGYQGYGGVPSQYPQQYPPRGGYATSNYDPVALQLRIVQAKQVNLMYKQNLVRNMILNNNTPVAQQNRHEAPYGNNNPYQPVYPQQQQQPRLYSQEEPQLTSQSSLPLLQRDFRNERHAGTPRSHESSLSAAHEELFRTTPPIAAAQPYQSQQLRVQPPQVKPSTRDAYHRPTEAGDDEDHAIPFEDFAASSAPMRPRDDVKMLSTLAENMAQTVSDNTDALKKITAARKKIAQAPNAEKTKKKIEQMIKVNANAPAVMPLWRHKLNGRHDPPPETVLKGIRLFRLVARSLLNFVVKPIVASVKHQLVVRESGRKDLQKTLKIVAGGIDDWIGKLVQLPVSSVAQVCIFSHVTNCSLYSHKNVNIRTTR